jgi:dipeptidyl aminopeptidase/acylaminoacyl peptidase
MKAASIGASLLAALPIVSFAQPPVTAFTNYAKYESVTVSPRGTYLAVTHRNEKFEALTILKVPSLALAGQTYFGQNIDIDVVEWANDERLLVQPMRRFPGFTDAKVPTGEIIGIDANAKGVELLFGFLAGKQQTGTRLRQRKSMDAPARLIGRIPGDPSAALIQTYGYGMEGEYNAAYRMDVRTGDLKKVAISPVRDGTFLTDADQNIVFVYGRDREGDVKLFHRPPGGGDWKPISVGTKDGGYMLPIAPWGKNGEFLAYDNRDAPTDGVFSFAPGTESSKLLFRKKEVDVGSARVDPQGRAYMVIYDDHFPYFWYPDPEHPLAKGHQWLRESLPGHYIDIASVTDDMSFAVVRVSSPRNPLAFYYFDVKNRKVPFQLQAYPDLKPENLADVEPFEVKTRDGLLVRGFVTVPNVPVKKKLPTIVLVHGGPHGVYDRWGFDYEAQLFASRGYAVLQVNYRGSGGRGREFAAAGYRQWGAAMQDDVTDAVRWAIEDGVTDAGRVCIYGASYGAYAALTGAFREPQMFRCAVGMAGVYDLPLMFDKGDIQSVRWGVNYLEDVLGRDMEELKRRSPVYNAAKIRAPVLLIHGKDDERAPYEHAVRMRDALVKAGNAPEWLSERLEGHGFYEEGNRAAAYEKMLAFFAKHLSPVTTASN